MGVCIQNELDKMAMSFYPSDRFRILDNLKAIELFFEILNKMICNKFFIPLFFIDAQTE